MVKLIEAVSSRFLLSSNKKRSICQVVIGENELILLDDQELIMRHMIPY